MRAGLPLLAAVALAFSAAVPPAVRAQSSPAPAPSTAAAQTVPTAVPHASPALNYPAPQPTVTPHTAAAPAIPALNYPTPQPSVTPHTAVSQTVPTAAPHATPAIGHPTPQPSVTLHTVAPQPSPARPAIPFHGCWDLTVGDSGGWLEFLDTPAGPRLRIVPRVGGVKPVPVFEISDNRLAFSNTEWFGKWEAVRYDLTLRAGAITGTAARESGLVMPVSGIRAPGLRRAVRSWGQPIRLSGDLSNWKVMSPTKPGNWTLRDGVLANAARGPNLRTIEEFQDFRLELEFNCPQGSNSGVFLRGRYELQIEEEPDNHDPLGRTGSIYQFLSAGLSARRRPGEWRKLSITLVGRSVTVTLDGVTIIAGQEIPGPTSGGFNSREAEPGPIILQGDHGPVRFRNIVLIPGAQ